MRFQIHDCRRWRYIPDIYYEGHLNPERRWIPEPTHAFTVEIALAKFVIDNACVRSFPGCAMTKIFLAASITSWVRPMSNTQATCVNRSIQVFFFFPSNSSRVPDILALLMTHCWAGRFLYSVPFGFHHLVGKFYERPWFWDKWVFAEFIQDYVWHSFITANPILIQYTIPNHIRNSVSSLATHCCVQSSSQGECQWIWEDTLPKHLTVGETLNITMCANFTYEKVHDSVRKS